MPQQLAKSLFAKEACSFLYFIPDAIPEASIWLICDVSAKLL